MRHKTFTSSVASTADNERRHLLEAILRKTAPTLRGPLVVDNRLAAQEVALAKSVMVSG